MAEGRVLRMLSAGPRPMNFTASTETQLLIAAEQKRSGRTMNAIVNECLRVGLAHHIRPIEPVPLPDLDVDLSAVDVSLPIMPVVLPDQIDWLSDPLGMGSE
ncbi:hypothetical protein [Thiocystis violacea]|uniref:hypothetical protein n=1 Tax=Thiocystis violacea TaxID=13725 RepID=UPI001903CF8A|nr:hypothetical protein [Thiocystis violacea]